MFGKKEVLDGEDFTFESGKAHYTFALDGNVDGVLHLYSTEPVSVGLVTGCGYIPVFNGDRSRIPFRVRDASELRIDCCKSAKLALRLETRDLDKGTRLKDYTPAELVAPTPVPLELKALVRNAVAQQLGSQGITHIDVTDEDDLEADIPDQDDLGPGYMDEDEPFNPHPHARPSEPDGSPEPSPAATEASISDPLPAAPVNAPATTESGDTKKP